MHFFSGPRLLDFPTKKAFQTKLTLQLKKVAKTKPIFTLNYPSTAAEAKIFKPILNSVKGNRNVIQISGLGVIKECLQFLTRHPKHYAQLFELQPNSKPAQLRKQLIDYRSQLQGAITELKKSYKQIYSSQVTAEKLSANIERFGHYFPFSKDN